MAYYSCPVEFAAGALYVDDAFLGYSALTWSNSGGTGDGATLGREYESELDRRNQ